MTKKNHTCNNCKYSSIVYNSLLDEIDDDWQYLSITCKRHNIEINKEVRNEITACQDWRKEKE